MVARRHRSHAILFDSCFGKIGNFLRSNQEKFNWKKRIESVLLSNTWTFSFASDCLGVCRYLRNIGTGIEVHVFFKGIHDMNDYYEL